MSYARIPETHRFTCNGCGTTTDRASHERPPYWMFVTTLGTNEITGTRHYCQVCTTAVMKALDDVVKEMKGAFS